MIDWIRPIPNQVEIFLEISIQPPSAFDAGARRSRRFNHCTHPSRTKIIRAIIGEAG
jgi:hypothetical protein